MVGDTADYVKLVALVKKKVCGHSISQLEPLGPTGPQSTPTALRPALQKPLELPPSQFILGSRSGKEDSGEDLDDDTQICSCHVSLVWLLERAVATDICPAHVKNVSKGRIVQCIKGGAQSVADVKAQTKAGMGCGGCVFQCPIAAHASDRTLSDADVSGEQVCPS